MRTRFVHEEVIRALGGRCVSTTCKWIGEDEKQGCDDLQCLQIDHKFGNGRQAVLIAGSSYMHYKQILDDPQKYEKYQVLCANCNWIKRRTNNENGWGKPLSKKLSDSGRASYISKFRSLINLLPALPKPSPETAKAEEQIAALKSRLIADGVDVESLLSGGKPRNCQTCGVPICAGFRYCAECSATKKRKRDRQSKERRLADAIATGRTPCRSCVIRNAVGGKSTCQKCSDDKRLTFTKDAKLVRESDERNALVAILKTTGGIVKGDKGAASRLGMNESTLRYRLCKLKIVPRDYRQLQK